MRHTLSVLVENRPGVLMRVASLFSRRGYNIETLTVGIAEDPAYSRITLVIQGEPHVAERFIKQLDKLINVIGVNDLTPKESIQRSCEDRANSSCEGRRPNGRAY